jgi:magnesium chelatase family protein
MMPQGFSERQRAAALSASDSGPRCPKEATQGCHCGYHDSNIKQCRCSPLQIEHYLAKISGPLLDRIAIHVSVRPVDVEAWSHGAKAGMRSATMREMVTRAHEVQTRRFAELEDIDCNARIPEGMFATLCAMEPSAETLFVQAQKKDLVSARARGHIVRVARTIADLEGSECIAERHIEEAVAYRKKGQ